MSIEYDAIVVGARVAGAPTAMLLARMGHRVLILDRASMPSDTVSTHALLRSGVLQLERWGLRERLLEAATPPVRNITLGFGQERIAFEVRLEHGISELYAPRRHLLDGLLLEAAREAGAEFLGATRMVEVLRTGERVTGIEIESDGQRSRVQARVVIGADGVWSKVAKSVDAPTLRSYEPTNAIHYAYFEGVDHPGFWFQFTPGVNAGIIQTNDDMSCVFVARPRELMADFSADPDREFMRLLGQAGNDLLQKVSEGLQRTAFRGTPGLPGFIRKPYGPGWALVGDAGYTKDPISAHGISDALRDAELCARAVDLALRRPEEEMEALDGYQRMRDQLSAPMFRESQALARYDWGPTEASQRMRAISDAVRAECDALATLPEWSAQPALI
ncbi:MAG: NAD(P)/FAD-dependent oxidoreductase [Acidimicrobiia bacterium]